MTVLDDDDSTDEPFRFVTMNVTSFADPHRMSLDWLQHAVTELMEVAAGLGKDLHPELFFGTPDWRWKPRKYNEKNLAAGIEGLRDGTLDSLDVTTDVFQMETFLDSGPLEKRVPSSIHFSSRLHAEAQEPLVRAIKAGSVAADACTAYITVDEEADPYRRVIITEPRNEIYPGFLRYVHGYYWYTVVSPSHIKVLAEHNRRVDDAPVFSIDHIDGGRIGLQLSESLVEYSDEQLLALREFLDPLLRPGVLDGNPHRNRTFETQDRPANS
jgi:hypothetical protein